MEKLLIALGAGYLVYVYTQRLGAQGAQDQPATEPTQTPTGTPTASSLPTTNISSAPNNTSGELPSIIRDIFNTMFPPLLSYTNQFPTYQTTFPSSYPTPTPTRTECISAQTGQPIPCTGGGGTHADQYSYNWWDWWTGYDEDDPAGMPSNTPPEPAQS